MQQGIIKGKIYSHYSLKNKYPLFIVLQTGKNQGKNAGKNDINLFIFFESKTASFYLNGKGILNEKNGRFRLCRDVRL